MRAPLLLFSLILRSHLAEGLFSRTLGGRADGSHAHLDTTATADKSSAQPTASSSSVIISSPSLLSVSSSLSASLSSLLATLAPVSPVASIALAAFGRQDLPLKTFADVHDFGRALVAEPIRSAREGHEALLSKWQQLKPVLLEGFMTSMMKLHEGDVTGAYSHAAEAFHQVQAVTHTTLGFPAFLVLVALVALAWVAEASLTNRLGPVQDEETADPSFFKAFALANFVMSWYVVMHNFYPAGIPYPDQYNVDLDFARWGMIAAPWFFTMSGFCHSYTKLNSLHADQSEDNIYAFVKRAASWYPLYAASMIWSALRLWSWDAEDISHLLGNLMMVDGLLWDESTFPYSVGSWWITCLCAYLIAWSSMHQVILQSNLTQVWTILYLAFLIGIPSGVMEVLLGESSSPYRLIQFWPAFVGGQALAMWFLRVCMTDTRNVQPGDAPYKMRPAAEMPFFARYGFSLGLVILGFFIFNFSLQSKMWFLPWPCAPFFLKGLFFPIIAIMVIGLAGEADPLVKLMTRRPFCWTNRLSAMTFLLQAPVHNFVFDRTGQEGMSLLFMFCLFAASVMATVIFDSPWRRYLKTVTKA